MCVSTRVCGLVGFFQFEASFWDDWDQTPAENFTFGQTEVRTWSLLFIGPGSSCLFVSLLTSFAGPDVAELDVVHQVLGWRVWRGSESRLKCNVCSYSRLTHSVSDAFHLDGLTRNIRSLAATGRERRRSACESDDISQVVWFACRLCLIWHACTGGEK